MKKVSLALALVLVFALSLSGCKSKATSAAEAAIAKIGIVTLDSGDAIRAADEAYAALSDKDKEAVENYALLTQAQDTLEKLEDAEQKIAALGEVSFQSADSIAAARGAYDALTQDQQAALPNAAELETAESAYAEKTKLVGQWETEVDIAGGVGAVIGEELLASFTGTTDGAPEELPPMILPMYLALDAEGNLSIGLDEARIDKYVDAFYDAVCDVTISVALAEMAKEGVTEAEAEAAFQQNYGMGLREYVVSMLKEEISLQDLVADSTEECCYDLVGDKLFVWKSRAMSEDAYFTFTLEGDTLTLTEAMDAAADLLVDAGLTVDFLPLAFTKA